MPLRPSPPSSQSAGPRADAQRRKRARWSRVVYEWKWARDDTQGRGSAPRPCRAPDGAPARGPLSGRPPSRPKQDPRGAEGVSPHRVGRTRGAAEGSARRRSCSAPPPRHPRRFTLIESPTVSGDVVAGGWGVVVVPGPVQPDVLCSAAGVIGLQSMAVRPTLARPSTATTTPLAWSGAPDQAFAIADPAGRGAPLSSGATSAAAGRRALSG